MKALGLWLIAAFTAFSAVSAAGELIVYTWSEYIPDEIIEQFGKETGIKVTVSTYDSNEVLYAKVKMLEGKSYDIIVPSADYVSRMSKDGLLLPLDKSKLPNLKNIAARFMDKPFDPGNQVSVPFMWGSTSIVVDTDALKEPVITKLEDLWNPALKGKLIMPNDMRGMMGIGLKVLGYSLNDTDEEHLKLAHEKLKTLMPNVKVFNSDSPKQPLLNGEVQAGVVWSGEAYAANQENAAIKYVYPEEGYSLWMDCFAIPKAAPNVENAHKFIDFMCRPEVSAAISEQMGYSTPNEESIKLLPEKLRNNPIVNPSTEQYARGEFENSLGEAALIYEKYWTLLKTEK